MKVARYVVPGILVRGDPSRRVRNDELPLTLTAPIIRARLMGLYEPCLNGRSLLQTMTPHSTGRMAVTRFPGNELPGYLHPVPPGQIDSRKLSKPKILRH